jgi:hypothetical protein
VLTTTPWWPIVQVKEGKMKTMCKQLKKIKKHYETMKGFAIELATRFLSCNEQLQLMVFL